jgi:hypothetical protein
MREIQMTKTTRVLFLSAGLLAFAAGVRPARAVVNPCEDFFTGGGFLFETPSGARGNFGVGGGLRNGRLWGHLNYVDHSTSPGMHVKGLDVTSYEVIDETCRLTTGTCTIDGVDGTYTLEVCDNGEPGTSDRFSLTLSTGYVASGVIDGGNIQLHKEKCSDDGMGHVDDFVDE